MIGAIAGDVCGSIYEWHNIKTKDFSLFDPRCRFTDDSVMSVAVAEAILNGGQEEDFIKAMQKFGRIYPGAGYGGSFSRWLRSEHPKPYNSWGNGSAMRVSPCGWIRDLDELAETGMIRPDEMAERSAAVTHNHPEGIKGAQAISDCIYMARAFKNHISSKKTGQPVFKDIQDLKAKMKDHVSRTYGYNLGRTLQQIRPAYGFDVSCQGSVPEAIIAFLESRDFEDALKNAISIGGDSDTIAAIAGSIAEAAYGVPGWIREELENRIPVTLWKVVESFEEKYGC